MLKCEICGVALEYDLATDSTGIICKECSGVSCHKCASERKEDKLCQYCAMTTEELEFNLPLRIQNREKKKMPCPNCKQEVFITVEYKQEIWRSDDHGIDGKHKSRQYEISYKPSYDYSNGRDVLLRTERRRSFREALIEMNKLVAKVEKENR